MSPEEGKPDFRGHYAASQFRMEVWNQIKHQTARLRRRSDAGKAVDDLKSTIADELTLLSSIERFWAFPGTKVCEDLQRLCDKSWYRLLEAQTARAVRLLVGGGYRHLELSSIQDIHLDSDADASEISRDVSLDSDLDREERPYFEVLVVDEVGEVEIKALRASLVEMRRDEDEFIYDIVVVPSFEDAIVAVLFNHNIQSCVVRYQFPVETAGLPDELQHYVDMVPDGLLERADRDPSGALAEAIRALRPELDLFSITDETFGSVSANTTRCFRRVFYSQEDHLELHLCILKGIHERFETPFFDALRAYSHKPTGVFHALPISRGKSITKSHWIQDMGSFYGRNIFLAETSSTTGGLDSLLQPTGPIKQAQRKVARAFGAQKSFFVTNGTSTANKIVTQGLVRPGDFVLLSHDCHKSHPYALVLAGAHPVYLDAYPLNEFTMFGGVPLSEIKRQLFRLKQAGKLDKVRMLLLTNCTFDGIVYDPERVMREVLAIKPDMVFLWDEAWFAFACATPTYRRRTGMAAAAQLRQTFADPEYRARYKVWSEQRAALDPDEEATWTEHELLPDPEKARIRVYVTQSTHKTLTSLRQGSMIHVYDQDFERGSSEAFHEAYMTHTSTSPNYQILASLDVGRRQLELEGYELVRHSIGLATMIRRQIVDHPMLSKYFRVLRACEMIPAQYRPSGLERFYDPEVGFTRIENHWREDEFALDPLRISLNIGATGMDGDTFRKMLIERFDIQINKTTRNTVLFMVNIGSTSGSATYLLDVLLGVAQELDEAAEDQSDFDRDARATRVTSLTTKLPPLPHFSRFHEAFVADPTGNTLEGDMRRAFFLAYEMANCEHLLMDGSVAEALEAGRTLVSASFVTPYPPGFPVLVPGQVVTEQILEYLKALDVKEIHGYNEAHGLRIFTEDALARSFDALSHNSLTN